MGDLNSSEANASRTLASEHLASAVDGARPLVLVQISDVHLFDESSRSIYERLTHRRSAIDPDPIFRSAISEIQSLDPDLVIATGDLVVDARKSSPSEIIETFQHFNRSIEPLRASGIPFHPVIGNHDLVGVFNEDVDENESGYAKEMFMNVFDQNRSYYSFDQGGYHFIALDPNSNELWNAKSMISRYAIDEDQLQWLREDLNSTSKPVIVFMHEPNTDLINRDELLQALLGDKVLMIFSGHWHVNDRLDFEGIPEQVTSSLSGSWWSGSDLIGNPGGYTVAVLNGSLVETFYKHTGETRQINVIQPSEAIVRGSLKLLARIWSDLPVKNASAVIDNGPARIMKLTERPLWYEAEATIGVDGLREGYHTASITAHLDGGERIQKNISFKASDDELVEIDELIDHSDAFLGKRPCIQGNVASIIDLTMVELGRQPIFSDGTGSIPMIIENCDHLAFDDEEALWTARGLFERYEATTGASVFMIQMDELCPERVKA